MPCSLFQVDAFTDTPFAGNPAAVVLLPDRQSADWMQDVAAEMNLSETAFVRPLAGSRYRLRWFTPTDEVDLCGHATLASAHVLWSEGFLAREAPAHFDTASGALTATHGDNDAGWITLDFPTDPPSPTDAPAALLDGLGAPTPVYVGRTDRDYLVRLDTATAVRRVSPDMPQLASLDARGVIVTAPADDTAVDFVSRFFAPGVGVPEDPVTGSAHCALGPYWAADTGRTELTGQQASARGGTVRVRLDAPHAERIALDGRAVTVLSGRLRP
ncbi:MAG: PhzF family phenazine biosynthesis protein [Salinivenus sp.]